MKKSLPDISKLSISEILTNMWLLSKLAFMFLREKHVNNFLLILLLLHCYKYQHTKKIYISKWSGPRIDPWGTPENISFQTVSNKIFSVVCLRFWE